MNIRYTKIESLDDLFDELYDFINGELDDKRQTCTDDTLKCKYDYKKNNSDKLSKDVKEDLENIIKHQGEDYEELRKEYTELKHKCDILEKRNEEFLKAGKEVSKEGHAIADASSKLNGFLTDKVQADGYKIVNDFKVWVEFARKCGKLGSNAYKDMLDMIKKTVSCAPDGK